MLSVFRAFQRFSDPNGQRVAMWQGDVVYYLHTDHLGSTSVLSDESGQEAGERVAYLPYGGLRLGDASTLPTDYGFTGQRLEAGLGLMHYGARFYSPRLGRFVSADSIVPQPGEPQALNRYSYVLNRPLQGGDPTGHQGPGEGVCTNPGIDWQQVGKLIEDLAVAAPQVGPVVVVVEGVVVAIPASQIATAWAIQDNGASYPLPEEFDPANPFGATYPLPGSSTLAISSSMVFAMPKSIESMADHLGFAFGYGAAGLPGFPNPFDRHDPKKSNDPKVNARHIRNALKGIQENLGKMDMRTYLEQNLTKEQFTELTKALDNLVLDLTDQGYLYEQLGAELSEEILGLLTETGYIVP